MHVQNFGLSAPRLPGWSLDITRREPEAGARVATVGGTGLLAVSGEVVRPILHAATVALPAARGDFGSGVVDALGSSDVFVALVEYGPEAADQGLFAAQGMPRLAPSQFHPDNLQRVQARVSAAQHFFSVGGRAFCLFTVVGQHNRRMVTVPQAAALVRRVDITPRSALAQTGSHR